MTTSPGRLNARQSDGTGFARFSVFADTKSLTNLAIAAAFISLMVVGIAHHQMWRDETNAWGIVLASPGLLTLFHNLHYEGHPGLWHLLLWCMSWVTSDPAGAKVVQGIIAACFISIIALRSPFATLEKVLLLLNFYVVYEYAVVSRNYGIALLFALIYVDLRLRRPDRLLAAAIILGLLANTNIYATILSCALAADLVLDRILDRGKTVRAALQELLAPAAIFAGFLILCAMTVAPAPDISWRTTEHPFEHAADIGRFARTLVDYLGFGITPAFAALQLLPPKSALGLQLALVLVIWCALAWVFRRDRRSLIVLGLTAIGAVAFGQLIYSGSFRHWGILFVALVIALWIQQYRQPSRSWIVLLVLWLGAFAGLVSLERAVAHPYSNAASASRWLREHDLRDAALIGTPDTSAAGIAQFLGRPIYFLDCGCVDTFLRFNRRRDSYSVEQLPERLAAAVAWAQARPAIFIDSYPVSDEQRKELLNRGIRLEQLAAFTGAIKTEEDFYLYRVESYVPKP